MSDLIHRQEAKDAIDMALDHIDHVPPWVYDKLLNALNEVPYAEKAQLSEEDATKDATSDLISRKKALDVIRTLQTYKLFEGDDMILVDKADVQTELMMLPSAEPEIIRCKDCKYWQDNNGGYFNDECRWWNEETPEPDDFCSYAERRGESDG